jgi:hypothetical protein
MNGRLAVDDALASNAVSPEFTALCCPGEDLLRQPFRFFVREKASSPLCGGSVAVTTAPVRVGFDVGAPGVGRGAGTTVVTDQKGSVNVQRAVVRHHRSHLHRDTAH